MIDTMLEKLTDEQIVLMQQVKNEWIGKLNSLPKINKPKAKKLVNFLYELAGAKKPLIVFLDSPLALQYACNMNKESQVDSQVRSQVRLQVELQVRSQVESQKLNYYQFSYYGNITDFGWLGFYDFFDRLGIVRNKDFTKFKNLIDCGVYDMIQQDNICYVCGMPEYIKRDAGNNLHSETESAIKWKDGFELFFLSGVAFTKELWQKVSSKEISAIDALKIENIEQRYATLKYLGAEKLLKDLSAELIDKSDRGNELYCLKGIIPNKEVKLLKYDCPSTGRTYTKFVPFEMTKADEAQAWSFQLELKEYQNLTAES